MPLQPPKYDRNDLRDYNLYKQICIIAGVDEKESVYLLGFDIGGVSSTLATWRRGNQASAPGVPADAIRMLRKICIDKGLLTEDYPELKPWNALSPEEKKEHKPDASRHPSRKDLKRERDEEREEERKRAAPRPPYHPPPLPEPIRRVHPKVDTDTQAAHTARAVKQSIMIARENAELKETLKLRDATIARLEAREIAAREPNVDALVVIEVDGQVYEFELKPAKKD